MASKTVTRSTNLTSNPKNNWLRVLKLNKWFFPRLFDDFSVLSGYLGLSLGLLLLPWVFCFFPRHFNFALRFFVLPWTMGRVCHFLLWSWATVQFFTFTHTNYRKRKFAQVVPWSLLRPYQIILSRTALIKLKAWPLQRIAAVTETLELNLSTKNRPRFYFRKTPQISSFISRRSERSIGNWDWQR